MLITYQLISSASAALRFLNSESFANKGHNGIKEIQTWKFVTLVLNFLVLKN